jgi:hypothetical protein
MEAVMLRKITLITGFILLVLSACVQTSSPAGVVEKYLAAVAAKDDIKTVNLSCAGWEANAKADGASFEGVEVTLEDPVCTVKSEDGQSAVVGCTGRFRFTYAGGEEQEISLDQRDYLVVLEGGDWRMCGLQ